MSNNGNYGYFGTGSTGYAHYMQSFNATSSSNYSKSSHQYISKESDGGDFFWIIIALLFSPILIPTLFIKFLLD